MAAGPCSKSHKKSLRDRNINRQVSGLAIELMIRMQEEIIRCVYFKKLFLSQDVTRKLVIK